MGNMDLTEAIIRYQETGRGLQKLLETIGTKIYRYPVRRYGWSEDDSSEFFVQFYERLPGIIERYRYGGCPFEAFLFSSLKWQMKSFTIRKRRENIEKKVFESEYFRETAGIEPYGGDAAVEDSSGANPENTEEYRRALKRRFLYLAMKNVRTLTEDHIRQLAAISGCQAEWLADKVDMLRQGMLSRLDRLEELREKRNRTYLKLKVLEEEYRSRTADELPSEKWVRQIRTERERLRYYQDEIGRTPLSPTNRDIAEALGVPKGTVDSGLFYLKNENRELYQDDEFRYA